jgi:hypothetical protein
MRIDSWSCPLTTCRAEAGGPPAGPREGCDREDGAIARHKRRVPCSSHAVRLLELLVRVNPN